MKNKKAKGSMLKSKRGLALITIACVIAGVSISVLFYSYNIVEIRELPMSFHVENVAGINTDTDEIYFGSAPRGSFNTRDLHVESEENVVVSVYAAGNISSIVTISDNNFRVGPGNRQTIRLAAHAPEDDPYVTSYTGTLVLVFRRS